MIALILKAKPTCTVVLMTMNQPTREPAKQRPHFADYMAMYRRVAQTATVPLIDLLPAWERLHARDAAPWDQVVPDGIHPALEGSALITTPGIFPCPVRAADVFLMGHLTR